MYVIDVGRRRFLPRWTVKRRGELVASGWALNVENAKAKALAMVQGLM